MNLRARWAIIFGIISLIGLFTLTFILNAMILGFFWIYVFGDNPWPSYVNFVLWVIVIISFILWVVTIIFGYRYGGKLESKPKEETYRNSDKWLIIAIILLLFFVAFLTLKVFSTNKKVEQLRTEETIYDQLYRINNLTVTHINNNLILNISINGSYSGIYDFLINLDSSYLGQFHRVTKSAFISSRLNNQEIQIVVPYSDINKAYFEKLKTKADLSQPLLMDQVITIVVKMENSIPIDGSYHQIAKSSKRYSEMFSISCDKITCNVVPKIN